jgi:alpha-glucosidase
LNILVQTLPGVAITYQGEELVLTNIPISWEDTLDPQACNTNPQVYYSKSRDPARTPFPWDDSKNGGFSKADKTWLPAGDLYKVKNVQAQLAALKSHLKIYKKLVSLRKFDVLKSGTFEAHLTNNEKVLVYKREVANGNVIVVALNFDRVSQQVNLQAVFPKIPKMMYAYTSSLDSGITDDSTVDMSSVKLDKDIGAVFIKTKV